MFGYLESLVWDIVTFRNHKEILDGETISTEDCIKAYVEECEDQTFEGCTLQEEMFLRSLDGNDLLMVGLVAMVEKTGKPEKEERIVKTRLVFNVDVDMNLEQGAIDEIKYDCERGMEKYGWVGYLAKVEKKNCMGHIEEEEC